MPSSCSVHFVAISTRQLCLSLWPTRLDSILLLRPLIRHTVIVASPEFALIAAFLEHKVEISPDEELYPLFNGKFVRP